MNYLEPADNAESPGLGASDGAIGWFGGPLGSSELVIIC